MGSIHESDLFTLVRDINFSCLPIAWDLCATWHFLSLTSVGHLALPQPHISAPPGTSSASQKSYVMNLQSSWAHKKNNLMKLRERQKAPWAPDPKKRFKGSTMAVAGASTEVVILSTPVAKEGRDWAVADANLADEESVASTAVVAYGSVQCVKNLVSGTVFDMTKLNDYAGAACPICFDDFGPHVPKDHSWDIVLHSKGKNPEDPKEVKDEKKELAKSNTQFSRCVKAHVKSAHKDIPLWNMYAKQEKSAKHGRGKSAQKAAALTSCLFLVRWVYKKAATSHPFEDLCVSTEAVAPSAVIELFHQRFGLARGLLKDPRNTTFWFDTKDTSPEERQELIKGALAVVSDHTDTFRETFDPQQQTDLCKLTRDQVRNYVNNFFLWENGQELSKPYFSG